MKILVITPFYYIEGRLDLFHDTNVIHYFTKYWASNNEVCVFDVYPHSYKDLKRYRYKEAREYYKNGYRFSKDGIKVQLTEVQKYPGQNGHYTRFQTVHIMKQLKKFLDEEDFCPDIIVVHVPSYAESFIGEIKDVLKKDVPVIGVLHFTDIAELEKRKKLSVCFEKEFDEIYARSHGILKKAKELHVKKLREEIIQSGIPAGMGAGLRSPCNVENGLNVIYAGKLIARKNVDKIIEVIGKLKEYKINLNIVGDGPEKNNLKRKVEELKLSSQIHFWGLMTREDVIKKMAEANLFCMPSINETLGLTYIEAMAVGCVPIGTKDEGIDGVIIDGVNGFLVDPSRFIVDLEKCFRQYIDMSNEERLRFSNNAYETALHLDEKECSLQYLNIIKRSVGNV